MRPRIHIVLPDTQIKSRVPLGHIWAAARLIIAICKRYPTATITVIMLGDWWDFPSLSRFDDGKRKMEGRRIETDVRAGNEVMERFLKLLVRHMKRLRLVFCLGNHEMRIERFAEDNAKATGLIGLNLLRLEDWEVIPFEQFISIDGVRYAHYLKSKNSPRPRGGSIENRLKWAGWSFTCGHEPGKWLGRLDLNDGEVHQGLVCGSFYQHDEEYKGPQGNHHFRGMFVKYLTNHGEYDLETWSIKRLLREYG